MSLEQFELVVRIIAEFAIIFSGAILWVRR